MGSQREAATTAGAAGRAGKDANDEVGVYAWPLTSGIILASLSVTDQVVLC